MARDSGSGHLVTGAVLGRGRSQSGPGGYRAWLVLLALAVASCTSTPREMRFGIVDGQELPVWPPPPEEPRVRYAGQLVGDDNFRPTARARRTVGATLFKILTGVESREERVRLSRPQAGMVDSRGRILVTDTGRSAVFVFDPLTGRVDLWSLADWNQGMVAPIGIVETGAGEFLLADAELGSIYRLDADGEPLGLFAADALTRPTGMARDAATGRIYVADTRTHNIKVFAESGELLDVLGGPGTGPGEFNAPTFLQVHDGTLVVTDSLNTRIQVLAADGDPLKRIGRRGIFIGNLTRPKGVALDADGNLYVVESYYDHVIVFDLEGRYLLPIGGSGSEPGRFWLPAGAWSDGGNRIFVADMFNSRVVVLEYLGGAPK